jgi:hypothetical protein
VSGRLVLHVGAPKTGSTYLQQRMRATRATLREHGVYVPVLPSVERMAGNAKLLATVVSGEPSPTFTRAFPEIDVAALDPAAVVHDLLADWDPARETVVLSAENFLPRYAEALRRLIPAAVRCTVVLFVRRQDDWIESYHNQMVKVGEIRCDLPAFVDAVFGHGERLRYPDWAAHHDAWSRAFGECRVVFYEEARGDLFGAFARAAAVALPAGLPDVPRAQLSLDLHQLAYLVALDGPFDGPDFARRRAAIAEASRRLGAPARRTLLTDADRRRVRERFEPSNRRLLGILGRAPDDPVLCMAGSLADACTLDEVYASSAYAAFRAVADAIVADATTVAGAAAAGAA